MLSVGGSGWYPFSLFLILKNEKLTSLTFWPFPLCPAFADRFRKKILRLHSWHPRQSTFRHAIEEELEVLYDAYYEELEQYANYQQRYVNSGGTIPPPPGPGPFPGSVELDKNGTVVGHPHTKPTHHPPRSNRTPALTNGRKPPKHESEFDDDEGDEEDYDEDEEYDEEDEEEEEEEDEEDAADEEEEEVKPQDRRNAGSRGRRPVNGTKANGRDGLFNLGSSLTVTGTSLLSAFLLFFIFVAGPNNILTVADDLLKNDGQKFLEMMEQLAERRMQREEEAAADVEDDSDVEEDDEGDDEDEEEEDEDDEDDDEEVRSQWWLSLLALSDLCDMKVMTEEQKMEEGKRMFSIFAARMFEQRVLQAYREKVAQERQQQLLRELEDEDKLTKEREAKKQTQNQKKKDKKKYGVFHCFACCYSSVVSGSRNLPRRKSEQPRLQRRRLRRRLSRPSNKHTRRRCARKRTKRKPSAKRLARPPKRRSNAKMKSVANALQRKESARLSGNASAEKRRKG